VGRYALAVTRVLPLVLCLVGGGWTACRPETDERLGLEEKRASVRIEPAQLARGQELERAVATPAAEVAARLGAYRLSAVSAMRITAGDRVEAFDESWKLEVDGKGGSRITTENSHGYGFETVAQGKTLYVRPRYGRFARRTAEGDELARTQDGVQGVLASYLGMLGRFADRSDQGTTMVASRKARRIHLSLAASPGPLGDVEPGQAWRRSLKVSELDGEVAVDEETGAPLHATLEASWTADRPPPAPAAHPAAAPAVAPAAARPGIMAVKFSYRADVDQVGLVAAIAAPEGALPSVTRVRPQLDRQALLEGLVGSAAPVGGGDR